MDTLGSRLKEIRGIFNLTQGQFAEKAGSSAAAFGQYEKGEKIPGGKVLAGLAQAGVNINWLLIGEGPMLISALTLDFDLLEDIVAGMERAFLEKGTGAVFAKGTKWKWIKIVYALFSKEKPKENAEDEAYNLFMDLLP